MVTINEIIAAIEAAVGSGERPRSLIHGGPLNPSSVETVLQQTGADGYVTGSTGEDSRGTPGRWLLRHSNVYQRGDEVSSLLMPIMNGITFGALPFLCASGFTLVFGLMRVVTMSYGMLYLLGSYVGLSIQRATN